jgi:hypothetical protein
MVAATAGTTNPSGTRIAQTRLDAAAGMNAANTTSAMHRTATDFRVRGVWLKSKRLYQVVGRAALKISVRHLFLLNGSFG